MRRTARCARATVTGYGRQAAIAIVWLLVAFGLAVRSYRFTDR